MIMKKLIIILTGFMILSSFSNGQLIDEVITSLKSGKAEQLSSLFDNTIEIALPESSNSYSKNQATAVIKDFFILHQVKNFEVLHKGENGGSQFCIGMLYTKNGTFRTTIYIKQKADKKVVQEIRFELN
jgi:hypothetical protein